MKITVDQGELYLHIIGQGEPLLILHGGPGLTHDYLVPGLEELSQHYQLIFYDQRGSGFSTSHVSEETMTVDKFVQDIELIRQHLALDKITLLGHSWGALLAVQYAVAYPAKIKKLILLNSGPLSSQAYSDFLAELHARFQAQHIEDQLVQIANSDDFKIKKPQAVTNYFQTIFTVYVKDPRHVSLIHLPLTQETAESGLDVMACFQKTFFKDEFDFYVNLKSILIPTLIIHGKADPIDEKYSLKLHQGIAHSEYVLLKNSGHFSHLENTQETLSILKQFIP